MPRYASHIVPPIPRQMSYFERRAWQLWRSGLNVRLAAQMAGITPNQLRLLIGLPIQPRADNPPRSDFTKSKFVQEAQ